MKKLLATVLFTALCIYSSAQKAPIKYGDIPMEDVKMETYDKDSAAAALILADYGEAYVSLAGASASLVLERHIRIKILKKEGLSWADASVPLYVSSNADEQIIGLKASTYNLENGKIVETKMAKDGRFKEKLNRNIVLEKFTLPNVKEGSVIEYSYRVNSPFLANFPNWQFQYSIPARLTEYWAIIPDFFIMEKYTQGYLAPTNYEVKNKNQTNYTDKAHHWIYKDVPAFKNEPFMTSEDDYVSKINFALAYINFPGQPSQEVMGTWQKLNNELLESESFGKAISGSGFLKKKVDELLVGETDQLKKVEKIYNYVKETLEWDGYNDYEAGKLKDIFEKKKGTTGDINIALGSMLEKAGFMVDMVLLSTRDHGFVREQYPMSKQFNYVVCAVRIDGVPLVLDATEKYLPMGVLPERCLNGKGLMISSNFHGWMPLESKTKAKTITSVDVTLDTNSELKGMITISREGYDAIEMRKDFEAKGETDYIKNKIGSRPSWQVTKTSFENMKEISKPVKESHELVISDHVTSSGDVMYVNPFVVDQMSQNPFTLKERTYPVDYGSLKEKIYMYKITLPEGYTIDELPQSRVIALPGGAAKYTYNITNMGTYINVLSNFQINRNLFVQADYPNLREFYNQVIAKQSEQIVLKKK